MSSQSSRRIVLASASPRRLELCQLRGLQCEITPVDIDETPAAGEAPLAFVERMATSKAQTCVDSLSSQFIALPVLGSDTVVEHRGQILGKPRDREHAADMLRMLSATTHQVHTAVAVIHEGRQVCRICSSDVSFDALDEAIIERYLDTGEPMDKAGSYGIQGWAARFITRLDGSFSGVMGLPLYETTALFAEHGIEI